MSSLDQVIRSTLKNVLEYWSSDFEPRLPPERTATFAAHLHTIVHAYRCQDYDLCFRTLSHFSSAFQPDTKNYVPARAVIASNLHALFGILAREFLAQQTEGITGLDYFEDIHDTDWLLVIDEETAQFQMTRRSRREHVFATALNGAGEMVLNYGHVYRRPLHPLAITFRNDGVVDSCQPIAAPARIYESKVEEGRVYLVERLTVL